VIAITASPATILLGDPMPLLLHVVHGGVPRQSFRPRRATPLSAPSEQLAQTILLRPLAWRTVRAHRLQELLGLTDEELLAVLDADPLEVVGGDLDQKPELQILLDLLEEHDEAGLRKWLRAEGPAGRPIDLLTRRDFAAFENALASFRERGFVIRGPGASRQARPR
jgi:hypothetical protein